MSLEPKRSLHEGQLVRDKYEVVTADITLDRYDQVVRVSASPTTGAITITLAPVNECAGRFVAILARDADGTNDVTIQDQDESEDWADITLDGATDGVVLYSDGMKWWVPVSDVGHSGTTVAPTTAAPTTAQ